MKNDINFRFLEINSLCLSFRYLYLSNIHNVTDTDLLKKSLGSKAKFLLKLNLYINVRQVAD